MADGKDIHTALDNPGVWQRSDCSLTLQDIPCPFPKEKFSSVVMTSGTSVWSAYQNEIYGSQSSVKLFFPSARLKDSYNNNATIPKRIRLADLEKKQKMQKAIFHILLLCEFFRRSVHPPDQWGLKSLSQGFWAFFAVILEILALLGKMKLLIPSLAQLLLCSHSHGTYRLPLALVWFKYQIFSSNIDKLLASVFQQCSGREHRQANASLVWQALWRCAVQVDGCFSPRSLHICRKSWSCSSWEGGVSVDWKDFGICELFVLELLILSPERDISLLCHVTFIAWSSFINIYQC